MLKYLPIERAVTTDKKKKMRRGPVYMTKWVGHRKDKSEICERLAASTLGLFRIDCLAICLDHLSCTG